ncbi:restriction endonuclease subunit S [Sphingomonas sp. PvP015]|uniref:restriction endonuclease subunit S n=1 Tax=Sphingomonas sp. PvP015 TaxID=3156388 RepID=UPI0033954B30
MGDTAPWPTMAFSEAVAINPKRPLPKTGDVPFLDMAALPLRGAPVQVLEKRPVASGGARFQAGDTLFARITPCAENGKLGFVSAVVGDTTAQGSTEFVVMGARDGLTLPEYVRWLSGWSFVRNHAIGLMEGTSGRQRIPAWAFDEIEVPVPPLDEQRRIAEVLRSVDEAIAATQAVYEASISAQVAAFETFLQSGNYVPGSAPVTGWTTGKIDGVGRLPAGWQIVKLVDVARLESGHTPDRKKPEYWDGGDVEWISLHDTQNLGRCDINETDMRITQAGLANSSARLLPPGTVCFSRTATVGKCVIMAKSMATSQDFANFICSPKLNNRYLLHLMRWMQPVWKALASGSTHKTIYMPTFKALQIVLPSRVEQDGIAATMDSFVSVAEGHAASLSRLRSMKAALMSDLLSGRVRVPA